MELDKEKYEEEFLWILEAAVEKYEEGMNWIDFSNTFFSQGSEYMPEDEEERERYVESEVFEKVMDLKHDLEDSQPDTTLPDYSGQTRIRMPKSLHKDLKEIAAKEGTSLNQLMVYFLGQSVVRYKQGD